MTRVAIVGGGIAGLTAALRLAERGCSVTVYEQQPMLGGNLASRPGPDSTKHDVYPHMYLNWYHNFWQLLRDVKVTREKTFVPMSSVKQLAGGDFPRFAALTDFYSPWHALQNLFSGVAPPADEFLFAYASVDLLAEHMNPTVLLDEMSVNGFLRSRPYITERAAEAFNSWITRVWAIPSYLASASDYQTFLKHGYAEPVPALWLLSGAAEDRVVAPIEAALREMQADIRCSTRVTRVTCNHGRVEEIKFRENGKEQKQSVDDLVLAVPPPALSRLIRSGAHGHRVIDCEPALADVARLRTETIPIVHLYFTRTLEGIPREPVGLVGAKYGLAFTDVSQTRDDVPKVPGSTVIALSSSDRYGLPGTGPRDDAMAMIRELARYITNFEAGASWGQSKDIDWKRTCVDEDIDTRLFVNETGCEPSRPPTRCTGIANLHLAGDFCQNHIGLTSVEAAVVSGLNAAKSVAERRGLGPPVEIIEPRDYPALFFAWLRVAWAPYAAAAKMWSGGSDFVSSFARLLGGSRLRQLLAPTPSRLQR